MREIIVSLTWLDIFFIAMTVISLVFNIIQFRDKSALIGPFSSSLIALFNDIKGKSLQSLYVQKQVQSNENPHQDLDTLKWEYANFAQSVHNMLNGFQEAVVGMLITLNPEDKDGKRAFRATEYGLTEDEKKLRDQNFRKWRTESGLEEMQPPKKAA